MSKNEVLFSPCLWPRIMPFMGLHSSLVPASIKQAFHFLELAWVPLVPDKASSHLANQAQDCQCQCLLLYTPCCCYQHHLLYFSLLSNKMRKGLLSKSSNPVVQHVNGLTIVLVCLFTGRITYGWMPLILTK